MTKKDLERKKICEAAVFAMNGFWKGQAETSIVNSNVCLLDIVYGYDFDARNELESLGIEYNSSPKNWVRGHYCQSIILTNEVWENIKTRYQRDKSSK